MPTATLLTTAGYRVIGIDTNPDIVRSLSAGKAHIIEPELDILLKSAVEDARLSVQSEPSAADVFMIAVPTPLNLRKRADITYVLAAAKSIAPFLKSGDLIILESTSPVGTTSKLVTLLGELRPDLSLPTDNAAGDIAIAYCPERVLPGRIFQELVENDRLIGGVSAACALRAQAFYRTFVKGTCHLTTAKTAELAKLTENAYRDLNIAFANELSMICDAVDVDVEEMIALANCHPRVNILKPGIGVGGHCIAVDPWFIVDSAAEQATLIRQARQINDFKTDYVITALLAKLAKIQNPKIACFGLTFKPNVDDCRGSPALKIVKALLSVYPTAVTVVEPHLSVLPSALEEYSNLALVSVEMALKHSTVFIGLVAHSLFSTIDPTQLANKHCIDYSGVFPRSCVVSQDTADTLIPAS